MVPTCIKTEVTKVKVYDEIEFMIVLFKNNVADGIVAACDTVKLNVGEISIFPPLYPVDTVKPTY